MQKRKRSGPGFVSLFLLLLFIAAPSGVYAREQTRDQPPAAVEAEEKPSSHYDSILYSEIGPRLAALAAESRRVRVEILGHSAGGRELYLVTLSDPQTMGRLGRYQAIRRLMLTDPAAAQELLARLEDFKVPVLIQGSIHGNEYPGVDAALRLIETLAFDDSPEVQAILESVILLVNVVANPDGRVLGTRQNADGFDLNRDLITQSQPETRAIAGLIAAWNPMVMLDLHGFVNPMLIEPCTPLHNPNYEYDLYIQWAYYQAEAMEAELLDQTGFSAQIPFRDEDLGWDDWAPSYTPMYAMFHGAYGHTLETPFEDERGVDAHFAAVWGALKFVAEHRAAMLYDQIEIFRRGFLDLPQMLIPDELLDETQFDQYNELTIKEFPTAYLIPPDMPGQLSAHQPVRLVNFLLENDVQVEIAPQEFEYDDLVYPAGTYVVWMDQPKRGLANTILEDGLDLSDLEGISFYSPPAAWSNRLLWGVQGAVVPDELGIDTVPITAAASPQGSVEPGTTLAFAYLPSSLEAFRATNALLLQGEQVLRAPIAFRDDGREFGAGVFLLTAAQVADTIARDYALQVYALTDIPAEAVSLHAPRVLISPDPDLAYALQRLGFQYTISGGPGDIAAGAVLDYDVWINPGANTGSLPAHTRSQLEIFFLNGGDYIGLGAGGAGFAVQNGFIPADLQQGSGNGIVRLQFNPESSLAAGYGGAGSAFVYSPVWFLETGDEVEVISRYAGEDFFIAGYWPDWQISGAAGMPAAIHQVTGGSHLTLIGYDLLFRGHPEDSFRMLGNAIFAGLE